MTDDKKQKRKQYLKNDCQEKKNNNLNNLLTGIWIYAILQEFFRSKKVHSFVLIRMMMVKQNQWYDIDKTTRIFTGVL